MRINANTSEYFIELLRSALHDKSACRKPEDVSWNELFEYAKSQSLSSMAYSAICKSCFSIGDELAQEWNTRNSLNLVKYFNQEHEYEQLSKAFSEAAILHMPLKGSIIRNFFPAPEMREMCDLDILVKPEDLERAHEIMLANGYCYIEEKTTSHNREYHKLPYMNVEVHTYLVPQESQMFSYYAGYWDKAERDENGWTCRMSWDDCYVFMLAHAYKHFYLHGTGIRSVLDIYVMRDKLKDVLNHEYITGELTKLGILDFALCFERLAECWFAEVKTEVPQDLLQYQYRILESGTFGDEDYLKTTALRYMRDGKTFHSAKRKMALKKLFPSYTYMKTMYPCLKYVPFLLPLFWLIRWINTLLVKPKKISGYFRKLKHLSLPGDEGERR